MMWRGTGLNAYHFVWDYTVGGRRMFVWVFHRISGVLLIVLLALKFATGYANSGRFGERWEKPFGAWHSLSVFQLMLLFLVIFHAGYGLRTILMDLGWIPREKLLFWVFTVGSALIFAVLALVLYL